MSFTERVAGTILRYSMVAPGSRVGVAVSGGADSMCLLNVLLDLAPRWNLRLGVVHVNHGLRGAESDEDEAFVRRFTIQRGLEYRGERAAIPASGNLEENARHARLDFFHRLISAGDFHRIATAHTQSDQAETVLYRILRGSYTTGLAGIRPVTPDGIVRPLLWVTRHEVESFLRDRGISWREDSSNRSRQFARNRIRHDLLPALQADYNQQLPQILARHAELAREDDAYWESAVDQMEPGRLHVAENEVILDLVGAASLAPALRRRLVRRAIERAKGDLRQIDFSHIDAVLQLADTDGLGHARVQLPGVDVLRSFDWVRLARPGSYSISDYSIPIGIPGSVKLPMSGAGLSLEVIENSDSVNLRDTMDRRVVESCGAALVARNWRPGDRYRRVGRSHEQKLKELFHEFRVPLWQRRAWPVLAAGGRIVWSRRFGVAAEFAATAESVGLLRVFESEPESASPDGTSI